MSALRGLRVSKFRHIYGQSTRREQCYESMRITTSAHDSQFCAVNPKFIAVVVEVACGGVFQVLPLKWTGKVDYHFGRVSGHSGPVTDLKWNPFNDNIIASSSEDCTIKLWHVPDEGLRSHVTTWLTELCGHTRRVAYIEWHPTADNVLASVGGDLKVLLWNVSTGECLIDIDCHEDTIYSLAFNRIGSHIATTCKDKLLRIIDARTGQLCRKGICHDGAKTSKVSFLGHHQTLVTTGFSRTSRRQMAIWDQNDLKRPLVSLEVDSSSGVLFPFYDQDLHILYIAGKGDGNIRYYEICDSHPWIHYLTEFQSRFPQRGLGVMPKRGLNAANCEIFRFYKVHTTQPLMEPLSFIVPRKSDAFQADLYPATAGPTPALTTEEWLCGLDKPPVLISLKTGFTPVTSKPVQVKKSLDTDEEGHQKSLLITADINNERKFRFLSEVTKPDYRDIQERDDYGDIVKQQQLREKLSERLALRHSSDSGESNVSSPRHSMGALSHEDMFRRYTPTSPQKSPSVMSAPISRLPSGIPVTPPSHGGHSPQKMRRISDSPRLVMQNNNHVIVEEMDQETQEPSKAESSVSGSSAELEITVNVKHERNGSSNSDMSSEPPLPVKDIVDTSRLSKLSKPEPIKASVSPMLDRPRITTPNESRASSSTRPGCIVPGPIVAREQTAHIKPFRIYQSSSQSKIASAHSPIPPLPREPLAKTESSPSAGESSDFQRLYVAQCRRVRELLEACEAKDRRIAQLESDVASLAGRLEKSLSDYKHSQEDVNSLRYEIDWKDQRIDYLEKQLSKQNIVGLARPRPSQSPESEP